MELLAVIAIIGLLAGIVITVGGGVQERGRVARARSELATLAAALESYKVQYGDYPWTGAFVNAKPKTPAEALPPEGEALEDTHAQSKLFNALFGVLGPKMTAYVDAAGDLALGRTFLDGTRFTFERVDSTGAVVASIVAGTQERNSFLDPWGRRYQYHYRNQGSPSVWTFPSFVLFSVGADGAVQTTIAASGLPTLDPTSDDLLAGR